MYERINTTRPDVEGSFEEGFLTAINLTSAWLLENLPFMYESSNTTDEAFVYLYKEDMEGQI